MQQVLMNLVQNARDATVGCESPTLEIGAEVCDGTIRVRFADNGPGIAPANLARLFDPSSPPSRLGRGPGSGCRSATASSNGTAVAWKRRTGPQGGALFTLSLPLAPA
jgi:two-component system sensor histidine kinase HupT/HoxJ